MNRTYPFFKTLKAVSALALLILTIGACNFVTNAALPATPEQITICHATERTTGPYDTLTLSLTDLSAHSQHPNDIIPAPVAGCPLELQPGTNEGKLTICHATGSATNPYNEIRIAFSALNGHTGHAGDLIPAPEGGCPAGTATPTPDVTLTVTEAATITATPTITETPTTIPPTVTKKPKFTKTPTAAPTSGAGGTISICHATGSAKNPYVLINVSVNGLNGHGKHARDIIPAPAGGCPSK